MPNDFEHQKQNIGSKIITIGSLVVQNRADFIGPVNFNSDVVFASTSSATFAVPITITPTTNQIVLGTTRTVTINAPTPASSSRVWTVPDITADGTFAALEGTQTFSGTKTFAVAVTITPTTNQLVLGTTRTVTITAPTPASSSRTWTIPDISGNATFAALEATQTFSGTNTFSVAVTITPTTNQIVLGTTRTVTITAPTPAVSSRTWTIPDLSTSPTFAALEGTQTFTGAKTFSTAVSITATSNHLVLSTASNTLTINASSQAAARIWSVPDISGAGTFAALEGTQTFSGAKTFSATLTMSGATIAMGSQKITGLAAGASSGDALRYEQLFGGAITLLGSVTFNPTTAGIVGTTTNDSAAAGNVGEFVTSAVGSGSPVTASNGVWADVTSITLSAGDWDLTGQVSFSGTITGTNFVGGIGSASGTSTTGLVFGDTIASTPTAPTAASDNSVASVNLVRKSISGSTTYYLKFNASFTVGTCTVYGRISARRRR